MFDSIWENLCSWNDEEWQLYTTNAEYEKWLDSQEKSYPLPEDCDPNYEDDFWPLSSHSCVYQNLAQ